MRSSRVRSSLQSYGFWEISHHDSERFGLDYTDSDEAYLEDHLRGGDEYHRPPRKPCRGCGTVVSVYELGLCYGCRFPESSPQEEAA